MNKYSLKELKIGPALFCKASLMCLCGCYSDIDPYEQRVQEKLLRD